MCLSGAGMTAFLGFFQQMAHFRSLNICSGVLQGLTAGLLVCRLAHRW